MDFSKPFSVPTWGGGFSPLGSMRNSSLPEESKLNVEERERELLAWALSAAPFVPKRDLNSTIEQTCWIARAIRDQEGTRHAIVSRASGPVKEIETVAEHPFGKRERFHRGVSATADGPVTAALEQAIRLSVYAHLKHIDAVSLALGGLATWEAGASAQPWLSRVADEISGQILGGKQIDLRAVRGLAKEEETAILHERDADACRLEHLAELAEARGREFEGLFKRRFLQLKLVAQKPPRELEGLPLADLHHVLNGFAAWGDVASKRPAVELFFSQHPDAPAALRAAACAVRAGDLFADVELIGGAEDPRFRAAEAEGRKVVRVEPPAHLDDGFETRHAVLKNDLGRGGRLSRVARLLEEEVRLGVLRTRSLSAAAAQPILYCSLGMELSFETEARGGLLCAEHASQPLPRKRKAETPQPGRQRRPPREPRRVLRSLQRDYEILLALANELEAQDHCETVWGGAAAVLGRVRRFDGVVAASTDRSALQVVSHVVRKFVELHRPRGVEYSQARDGREGVVGLVWAARDCLLAMLAELNAALDLAESRGDLFERRWHASRTARAHAMRW
jgi:hypothetical protein